MSAQMEEQGRRWAAARRMYARTLAEQLPKQRQRIYHEMQRSLGDAFDRNNPGTMNAIEDAAHLAANESAQRAYETTWDNYHE